MVTENTPHPRYHAAYIPGGGGTDPVIVAHCRSYSQAIRVLATLAMDAGPDNLSLGKPVVLLDLSSIAADDETAFKRLINDDPVISMIFKTGVNLGRQSPIEDRS